MAKTNNNSSTTIPTHLEDDVIIAYLDGELSEEEKISSSQHLENCWACRSNVKVIQDRIDNFMSQRQEILIPKDLPPSEPALKLFNERLQNYKSNQQSASVFNFLSLKSKLGISDLRSKFSSFKFFFSFASPFAVRLGIASLAVTLIAVLLVNQLGVRVVSASELLKNADEARKASLSNSSEPVIHQKLQVRRTKNNTQADTVNLEIWEDTNRNNYRQAIETEGTRQLIVDRFEGHTLNVPHIFENERPVVLTELSQILQHNHMNPDNPLSAASFKGWRDSLQAKNEIVNRVTLDDDTKNFELIVTPLGELNNGQITEASYKVRETGWTPLSLKLEVKDSDGTTGYEITQHSSEVVALNQLPPEIFSKAQIAKAPVTTLSPGSNPNPSPLPSAETVSIVNTNSNSNILPVETKEIKPKNVPASADLEVEVLQILSQVKADMGEQIDVKRTADGYLVVSGVVETDQRKTEILKALNTVTTNPSVKIEIVTVAEAVAREQRNKKSKTTSTPEDVTVQNNVIATESDLRAYFERQGGNTDEVIRRFSDRMVSGSRQTTQHLWAIKKLLNQFSPAEVSKLTPEARSKWLALIRSHARAYQEQLAGLRRELKPIFFPGAGEGNPSVGTITSDADLQRTFRQLFDAGIGNDSIIRSAFSASDSGNTFTALRAPQFWQSLKTAEALAAAIQTAK